MMMAAVCLCFAATDDSEAINVSSDTTYAATSSSVTFTVSDDEAALYYTAELLDSDGTVMSDAISSSYANGQLASNSSGNNYTKDITVTCPDESGKYRMHVLFYKDSDRAEKCGEKTVPLKVVDPIVLTVTLSNTGSTDVSFTAYFKINGVKVDDSEQSVTVSAGSTEDVTYDYVVDEVSDTTYMLCTDNVTINSVAGLDQEKKFYSSQYDATTVTIVGVVAIVILVVVLVLILRKPVVNKGKPKARR